MITSTLSLLSVAALILGGHAVWTRARARASLQPVRVRAERSRHFR
jgi:hypothetical protein